MREFALVHLRDQKYLEDAEESVTIESIIDHDIMPKFEETKRSVSLDGTSKTYLFKVPGLKPSRDNPRLLKNHFIMS
jgi:hypothetical protein